MRSLGHFIRPISRPQRYSPQSVIPSIAAAAASYSDVVLADSPKLYLPMQEASGNPVDASGNNLTATANGSLGYRVASGRAGFDYAMDFSKNDHILVTYNAVLGTQGSRTVEMWVHADTVGTSSYQRLFDCAEPIFATDSSGNLAYYDGSAWRTTAYSVLGDGMHHLVMRVNVPSAVVEFYWDGAYIGNRAIVNTYQDAGSNRKIGGVDTTAGNAANFDGQIAQVAYYDGLLSADRITAHYNAGIGA